MDGTFVLEYPAIVLHIKDRIKKDVLQQYIVVVYSREGKFAFANKRNLSIPPIYSN